MPAADARGPEPLTSRSSPTGNWSGVVAAGELDLLSAARLELEVLELCRSGSEHVVVDLRAVAFLDSTGLRVLPSLRDHAAREGLGLTLVPGPAEVQRVFLLTGTRGLFRWREG